jgi:hypothetical protein
MNLNQSELDRLCDGALSNADYRDLLQRIDRAPDGWRRCALTFLEHQAWHLELQDLHADTEQFEKADANLAEEAPLPVITNRTSLPLAKHSAAVGRKWSSQRWLSVAALLLISFGIGWLSSDRLRGLPLTNRSINDMARRTNGALNHESSIKDNNPMPAEDMQLVWKDGQGQSQELTVPVYRGQDLESYWAQNQTSLPGEFLTSLQKAGFQVETTQRSVLPARDRNGKPVVLPVEQLKVTPVSRKFQ